jgi:hypothetical protein
LLKTTTTDGNGNYLFSNLAAGTYKVKFSLPSGYSFTTKDAEGTTDSNDSDANSSGWTDTITLTAGQTDYIWDAGLKSTSGGGC